MLTKTSAKQLSTKGIRVNCVNPGPVRTGFVRTRGITDKKIANELYDKVSGVVPLKITAEGDDVANVILFLANNNLSRNITGTIVVTDSGMLLDLGCTRDLHNPKQ